MIGLEYKILSAYADWDARKTVMALERAVASAIADGWEPLGGIGVGPDSLHQAIVRRKQIPVPTPDLAARLVKLLVQLRADAIRDQNYDIAKQITDAFYSLGCLDQAADIAAVLFAEPGAPAANVRMCYECWYCGHRSYELGTLSHSPHCKYATH